MNEFYRSRAGLRRRINLYRALRFGRLALRSPSKAIKYYITGAIVRKMCGDKNGNSGGDLA